MLAICLLACVTFSETYDFDGLRMSVLAKPGEPTQRESSKVWQGRVEVELGGKKQNVAMYSVVVTTVAGGAARALADDQVVGVHERTARANKLLGFPNLRTTVGLIGTHKLLVLNGSAIVPNAVGKPSAAYWVSFAFARGNRAYEFNMISATDSYYREVLANIASMEITAGTSLVKPTALAPSLHGEYWVEGIPFGVISEATPFANPDAPADSSFDGQYNATVNQPTAPTFFYRARKLKANESRTDGDLFRHIAKDFLPESVAASTFDVQDGSAKVEMEFRESSRPTLGFLRFERSGDWIAVLASTAPKTSTSPFKGFDLKRRQAQK